MTIQILIGDVFEKLAILEDESIDCVVTSPPYWALRDYGMDGQIGSELTIAEHINVLVSVFREIKRVLKPSGTVWLNYGDSYAANRGGTSMPAETIAGGVSGKGDTKASRGRAETSFQPNRHPSGHELKHKDLMLLPARIVLALQDDGWWVRSEIVWHKPNPMPESATDRPSCAHEKIFLLTKSSRYYYDADAVRTESVHGKGGKMPDGWDTDSGGHGRFHRKGREHGRKTHKQRGHNRPHAGFNDRWDSMSKEEQQANGANLRNVWTVPTKGFPDAHFATFPPDLIEPCIKAGCPIDGMVLDPFGGSGTTGLVADRLKRNAILIELNPEYAAMAHQRIINDGGMFADVSIDAVKQERKETRTIAR